MSEWKKVKIGDFLKRKRIPIQLKSDNEYKLITIKLYHKGVFLRCNKKGSEIHSNMYKVSKGDFILSGIDARNGAFGIVPDSLDGAIVTNDFWYFDIDESIIKKEFFLWLTSTPVFLDACQKASMGETQRIRLQKDAFFNYQIKCPSIGYQDDFIARIKPIIEKIKIIQSETEKQTEYAKLLRQNILQEAIEGKLTADLPCRQAGWRNPNFRNLSGKKVPKISDKYFTYVLECDDGTLYKGFSQNLFERINRHLEGYGAEWTQNHQPVALIHFEEFKTEKEAVEREKYFKSGSGREFVNKIRNENKLNYDAEALFEQIQEERNSKRKQKELSPITDEDLPAGKAGKPFEIPTVWKWIRLGAVIEYTENLDIQKKLKGTDLIKYVDIDSIDNQNYKIRNYKEKSVAELSSRARRVLRKDYIIYSTVRPYLCNIAIIKRESQNYIGSTGFNVFRTIGTIKEYVFYFLLSDYIINLYKGLMQGFNSPSINNQQFENTMLPLRPLTEQKEIVKQVEKHLQTVTELDKQIAEREQLAKQLMQSILREAFEEN